MPPPAGPGVYQDLFGEFLTNVLMFRNLAHFTFVEIDAQEVKQ